MLLPPLEEPPLEGALDVKMTGEMYCPDLMRIHPLLRTVPVTLVPRDRDFTTREDVLPPDRTLPEETFTYRVTVRLEEELDDVDRLTRDPEM
ncbi:MAG: hypothetical protein WBA72_06990 [Ornithinimicrobium sp.]